MAEFTFKINDIALGGVILFVLVTWSTKTLGVVFSVSEITCYNAQKLHFNYAQIKN